MADAENELQRGRAAWPEIALGREVFAAYLAARAPDPETLALLNAPDLYLACACAAGDPAALAAFEARYGPVLESALAGLRASSDERAEVRQSLRARLFVADGETAARITQYSGRGSLASWLRVVATREALMARRRRGREEPALDDRWLDRAVGAADPELEQLKARYGAAFRRAFGDALGDLEQGERLLLRYHFLDGLAMEAIGALLGVHQTTISRKLARARTALLAATERRLGESLGLDRAEVRSILRLIESRMDVSLRALGDDDAAG